MESPISNVTVLDELESMDRKRKYPVIHLPSTEITVLDELDSMDRKRNYLVIHIPSTKTTQKGKK